MSLVTNVILTASVDSDLEIDSINRFLQETDGGGNGKFIEVSGMAGGSKCMECRVYLSAFNFADTEVILRAIDQAPWRRKDRVQVFVMEQEDDVFREVAFQGHGG